MIEFHDTEIQRTNEQDLWAVMAKGDTYGNDLPLGWLECKGAGWTWETDDGEITGREADLHSAQSALVTAIAERN